MSNSVVSTEMVLGSFEPMKIARQLMGTNFQAPSGRHGLRSVRGEIWSWYGGQWRRQDLDWLEGEVMLALEDAKTIMKIDATTDKEVRFAAGGGFNRRVLEVVGCLKTLMASGADRMPMWVGEGHPDWDPDFCVPFQDVVVSVEGGELRVFPRDDGWFGPYVLPVEYQNGQASSAGVWQRCLGQWSAGEKGWEGLLQRWWGYCFLGWRDLARWMFMFGKIRAGKGVNLRMMSHCIGQPAFFGTSLEALGDNFGLDGMQNAKVLALPEVNEMDGRGGERVGKVLKTCLGQDVVSVNVKHKRAKSMMCDPAPWVCGNEILTLPDKGQGLSGKMLPLHFTRSFVGKQDPMLEKKLREGEELRALCLWALEGARQLAGVEAGGEHFPMPVSSRGVAEEYQFEVHRFDRFLSARFKMVENGFVPSEFVLAEWRDYVAKNKIREHIPSNMLIHKVVKESSWDIRKHRLGEGGKRGIVGIQVRKKAEDEA